MKETIDSISKRVEASSHIVVVQADNPDGDSIGSALALESILSTMGKQVSLFCAVDMPGYLKYLTGWSRVTNTLPANFDLSIIVDASSEVLLAKSKESGEYNKLAQRDAIILDHHAQTTVDIPFAVEVLNDTTVSSTAELIFMIATKLDWDLGIDALEPLATGVLGDTQGLSNSQTQSNTYRVMADLVELGLDRPLLEEKRREYSKMTPEIFKYKARLIERTLYAADGRIAYVTVPHDEIMTYSPSYNPGPLIQTDMLQTEGVLMGIVFKVYNTGKITGMIRCNPGAEIAGELAAEFGGGGHGFASGFRVEDGRSIQEIKSACLVRATELLESK